MWLLAPLSPCHHLFLSSLLVSLLHTAVSAFAIYTTIPPHSSHLIQSASPWCNSQTYPWLLSRKDPVAIILRVLFRTPAILEAFHEDSYIDFPAAEGLAINRGRKHRKTQLTDMNSSLLCTRAGVVRMGDLQDPLTSQPGQRALGSKRYPASKIM